ncbi:hypothetical protein AVEN_86161-1 [Araneus ventricosus]|uniref:Uncharacterized protein n=1 Tax=Araneus ventricosus TaxID=182803 RepID=A0A4Y2DSI9_ARAVE|nr:hypothetical protein AVEN_86161-1 [Araneus ventricosus]
MSSSPDAGSWCNVGVGTLVSLPVERDLSRVPERIEGGVKSSAPHLQEMGPFLPITKLCLSLLNRIGARRTPCISLAPCVSTRDQMAVNFKRRPSGMTQSGKALSAPFSNRSLLATWEARSLFPWESLVVPFRTSQ